MYPAHDLIFFHKTLKVQGVIRQQKAVRAFISKYKVMGRSILFSLRVAKFQSFIAFPIQIPNISNKMESTPKVLNDKGSYNTKMEPATKPSNSIISLR